LLATFSIAVASCGSAAHLDAEPPSAVSEPADPAEPAEPAEPTEPADPTDPAEPPAAPPGPVAAGAHAVDDAPDREPATSEAVDAGGLRDLADALETVVVAGLEGRSPPLPLPTARALDDRVEVVHATTGQLPPTPVTVLGTWLRLALTYDAGAPPPERCWDLMGSAGTPGFEVAFGVLVDPEALWLTAVRRGARRVDPECVEPAPALLRDASLALHARLAAALDGGGSSSLALPADHPLAGPVAAGASWAEWDPRLSAHLGTPPVTQRFQEARVVLRGASGRVWIATLTFEVARHLPESERARIGDARWVLGVTPLVAVAPAPP
jgi:hypothetical protein